MPPGNASSIRTCPACGGSELEALVDLGLSPASAGSLHDQPAAARNVLRGRLDLGVCRTCGHVANQAFDPGLVAYDEDYDNSLHFSPSFQRYAERLAERLARDVDLSDSQHVVEIGSGRGDFLAGLVAHTGATATGYDPTYHTDQPPPGVTLVPDYFRPEEQVVEFDLLVCRHVLEHLDDPHQMLRSLRDGAPRNSTFYIEVPSAEFNFGPEGLWDCIYPHVSYFCRQSLISLVERSGLVIQDDGFSFHGQFLWVLARPGESSQHQVDPSELKDHLLRLDGFASRWTAATTYWRNQMAQEAGDRALVLWGAGAKGMTFLNAVDPDGRLTVVDVNPRKWGRYLPGSGHRVNAPTQLAAKAVSRVLVTNPAYQQEIAQQLQELGLTVDVIPV